MPADFNVYREQLSSLHHGHALWEPGPIKGLYDQVAIGDVGYVSEGWFYRLFNVTLPWDHPSNNRLGKLEHYNPLNLGKFINIRMSTLAKGSYHSRHVSSQDNVDDFYAKEAPDAEGVTYNCQGPGALLFLPHDGDSRNVIRTKVFEDYIRDHAVGWFKWSRRMGLGVECMEELILVTGCTLVTSWAAAAFIDAFQEAKVSLAVQTGGGGFIWSRTRGYVSRHNSQLDPNHVSSPQQNQCVFIRGFRAKRRLFRIMPMRAAAEPRTDAPDNRREDNVQMNRVSDASKYRDPLIAVLDYILENCPEGTIAVAHDDDLQRVEKVETLTADAVEKCLCESQFPVRIENGAARLGDQNGDTPSVLDEKKAVFWASAELKGEPIPLIIHPVLMEDLLKLEIGESVGPDYDLSEEELTSSAVRPPVPWLELENFQGYPQCLSILSSGSSPDVGVTVQDVLRAIYEDLRKPSPRPAWDRLRNHERSQIKTSFKKRCENEEELSKGLFRFDYLCGRDRLQIFPKLSPHGVPLSLPITLSAKLPELTVTGTSIGSSAVVIDGSKTNEYSSRNLV